LIDNKSVSRKHLVITVENAQPGSGSSLYQKSILKIRDYSKIGTTLDRGTKFVGEERILDQDEHTIKLGSFDQLLR